MAVELGLTTCITLLQYSIELAEQVKANKQLCAELAADLAIIESILSSLNQQEKERAKRHHLNLVLKKLRTLTNQTVVLFERSKSGRRRIKIKNYFQAMPIQNELRRLKGEVPSVIGMLCLVFHIKQQSERFRNLGLTEQQSLDESVFDTLEDIDSNEEYYIVDDNDD
ncbi:unnamed protein product [Rotaria socialis]|uniref:Uncharacterized protein n=1 Tax=Rotaria socialis TaxID=392032 RepID=A0A820ZAI3_9BILA|nr:unnamed protein product [Rotaria socialis]CAF3378637.1 unnamed protein product [Rotaria socialis]CAF3383783.1 unnamed protein product [Rotaria socialis]CAF4514648.1 unnamed protein product [Rotaria socialis]CAF4559548.1 unnamed protein product [Rotaria socialis]